MVGKLVEGISAEQIVNWLIIAAIFFIVIVPKLKEKASSWIKNDGGTINERVDTLETEVEQINGKLNHDFRRLTILEEAIATRIRNEKKSQHELYLLMRSNLILLDTIDTEEAIKCKGEMNEYVLRVSHSAEEEGENEE